MEQVLRISLTSKVVTLVLSVLAIVSVSCMFIAIHHKPDLSVSVEDIPPLYNEVESDYERYVLNPTEVIYMAGSEYSSITIENFQTTESFESVNTSVSKSDIELILMPEDELWSLVSNGVFGSYPTQPYSQIKSQVEKVYEENMCMITVKCWYWSNPDDDADMSKKTVTKKFAVNRVVAPLFLSVFEDIYNDPTKPVINIADAGMGTWVLRGKNHNSSSTLSGHAMGTTIDINPSTGSFLVNGTWYGNGYGHKAMPKSVWEQLPECHKKYHVLYVDCPIVQIFKSYGFYWGGDWKTGTDCMHLSFLGDGNGARQKGQSNYYAYN